MNYLFRHCTFVRHLPLTERLLRDLCNLNPRIQGFHGPMEPTDPGTPQICAMKLHGTVEFTDPMQNDFMDRLINSLIQFPTACLEKLSVEILWLGKRTFLNESYSRTILKLASQIFWEILTAYTWGVATTRFLASWETCELQSEDRCITSVQKRASACLSMEPRFFTTLL